ncbi:hypothetical protein Hanom_Chr01g00049661 [Helianthus anomalus]
MVYEFSNFCFNFCISNRTQWYNVQLPGSRLKTSLNARDLEIELELLQRQQMIDNLSTNLYNNRFGEMKPTNLDDVYGSLSATNSAEL